MNKTTSKSIGALLAGFFTVAILSIGTDSVLESAGIFPPPGTGLFNTWMLMLALLYRSAGIIGTAAATLGAVAGWNLSQHWYPIALIITGLPCTWLGGKLKTKDNTK